MSDLVQLVRDYYAACDSGDADRIAACFTDDASHYYQRMEPQHGGRAIAEHFAAQARDLDGRWIVENGIAQADQAVVEWTMTWRDPCPESRASTGAPTGSASSATASPRCGATTTRARGTAPATWSASTTRSVVTRCSG